MDKKKEFNNKSHPLQDVYDAMGITPPPPLTPEEKKELEEFLSCLKEAKVRDPEFMEKAMRAWAESETDDVMDLYDDLTASDIMKMLKDSAKPPKGPK